MTGKANAYMVSFIQKMDKRVLAFWTQMNEVAPTRLVGGSVRDVLMSKDPKDMDFATAASVAQIKNVACAMEHEVLSYGEDHGTIAVKIGERVVEVTTLRVDEVTDGRHAQVRFITDFKVDAERRDLTINAMSASIDGQLFDYFGGQNDLANPNGLTIRFVGEAVQRIKEDYLRILRYFRFVARYNGSMDPFDLMVIRENSSGLNRVSAERCWTELKGIAAASHAVDTLQVMDELGISSTFGMSFIKQDAHFARMAKAAPMAVIAATLGFSVDNVKNFTEKMKLSNAEYEELRFWCMVKKASTSKKPFMDMIEGLRDKNNRVTDRVSLDTIRRGLVAIDNVCYLNAQTSPVIKAWDLVKDLIDNPPRPTVTSQQLMGEGLVGKELGQVLREMSKEAWDKRVAEAAMF